MPRPLPRKSIFAVALFLLSCMWVEHVAYAAVVDHEVTATGFGESRDLALISALVNAAGQVEGVKVNSVQSLQRDWIKFAGSSSSYGQQAAPNEITRQRGILTVTKGFVKSYKILEENQINDGSWKVKVKAVIPSFESVGTKRNTTKLRTMAILPFRVGGSSARNPEHKKWVDGLANKLMVELTNSKKFRLLDRTFLQEYGSEVAELRSAETHPEDALRLGQKLGADYLIVGNLEDFDIVSVSRTVYGSTQSYYSLGGEIQYRLIEVATKEVVWVDTYQRNYTSEQLAGLLGDTYFNQQGLAQKSEAMKIIMADAADEMATILVEAVYPIRIIDAEDSEGIVLSLGKAGLQPGQLLDVYVGQKSFTDPDTGVSFKTAGKVVATLEITQVDSNYSVAKLIDGQGSRITKLALVRRRTAEPPEAPPQYERRDTAGSSDAPVSW